MSIRYKILLGGLLVILMTLAIMREFDFLTTKQKDMGQFVSEQQFKTNTTNQMRMTPQVIDRLRKIDVTEEIELKLEYFFYTNTAEKAEIFAAELEKLNYTVSHGQSAGDKSLFIVTGWTTKMQMTEGIIVNWTKQMCQLGYKFDCDFDGWGTTPNQ